MTAGKTGQHGRAGSFVIILSRTLATDAAALG
jgi:hypothetical protein